MKDTDNSTDSGESALLVTQRCPIQIQVMSPVYTRLFFADIFATGKKKLKTTSRSAIFEILVRPMCED